MNKDNNLIALAMKYNKIVLLIISVLVIFGVFALFKMPKQEFPTFTIRQGVVVGVYPGATSQEVEEQVTKPLENFLFTFKEVKPNNCVRLQNTSTSKKFVRNYHTINFKNILHKMYQSRRNEFFV